MRTPVLLVTALCASLSVPLQAQELKATTEPVAAPGEIAEPVRALLSGDATVVMRGANRLEFWWVKGLPLQAGTAEWSSVPEGAIVGVLRNAGVLNEIRGFTMKPGVYTLRYARQPQDGDHMGVSPNREFLLASPAAADVDPKPAGYSGTVALSKKTLGRSHPASLSIDPLTTSAEVRSVVEVEGGHKAVVVEVPTETSGTTGPPMRFGIILVGQIDH